MNTPLLLTSVALLAGVAARPIENNRRGDDLHELARSPESDDRQAFLGSIPSGLDSLNSLQLHDLHDNTHPDNSALDGSRSPRLNGVDSPAEPDPGLSSPYMGPQRHLSGVEQELESPAQTFISYMSTPSSPARSKPEQQLRHTPEDPNYSPMVVVLVVSSLAALVLLGLTVAVVYASQLLRRTMFQEDVWRSVLRDPRGEKGDDTVSEEEKVAQDQKVAVLDGSMDQGVIAAREMPSERPSTFTPDSTKPSENLVPDPDAPSLPDRLGSPSSVPTVYNRDHERNMGLALAAWTYDNWMTHFMMALFGWLGVFFGGGTRAQ